ncbi:MAG: hypothetical protein NTV00_07860 [Methylococcales bacterium]|nr:hypothetical protein [Methylococcales bacterium]
MNNTYEAINEANNEATLDLIGRYIYERDQLARIINTDDILELESELIPSDPKSKARRLPLSPVFLDLMNDLDSKKKITKYKHNSTDSFISISKHNALTSDLKAAYYPIFNHYCKPDPYTTAEYSDNKFRLRIEKLGSFTQSRYKTILRSAVDSGLFLPRHRTATSHKRTMEAIRNILCRRFYIKRYEWGLVFNTNSSQIIYAELSLLSKIKGSGVKLVKNTFYLHDGKRSQCQIKIYNIDAAQAARLNQPPEFRHGDRLKFEITYKTRFFKDYPAVNLRSLTHQHLIADKLYSYNKKNLSNHLLKKFSPEGLRQLYLSVDATGFSEFMKTFESDRTTQTNIDEIDADIKELRATLLAQSKRLDAIEQFIGMIDAKKDTRKLRSVK